MVTGTEKGKPAKGSMNSLAMAASSGCLSARKSSACLQTSFSSGTKVRFLLKSSKYMRHLSVSFCVGVVTVVTLFTFAASKGRLSNFKKMVVH